MELSQFPLAVELKEDLENYEVNWSLFEGFVTGMSSLSCEDWISFRLVLSIWI